MLLLQLQPPLHCKVPTRDALRRLKIRTATRTVEVFAYCRVEWAGLVLRRIGGGGAR
jgi:hypothetical protein